MARRTRHDTPKWAEAYPETPEGMDAMHVEGEVRRHLNRGTDPDEIDDDDVRQAYLHRLQEENAGGDDDQGVAPAPKRHRANPRPKKTPAAARSRPRSNFSHPLHWGTGARGHVVGKPSLRAPSRLSAGDGTGFAFGLVLYALGLAYIRYGPAGPRSWLAAKFLNRPSLTSAQTAAASAAAARHDRILAGPHASQLFDNGAGGSFGGGGAF